MSVSHPARRERAGFTLVEVLVVVGIIALLVGLLMPAVLSARARARRAQCANNQKEVSQAILQYENAKQCFPGYTNAWSVKPPGESPVPITVSWVVPILEYLGRNDLMQTWREGLLDPDDPEAEVVSTGAVRVAVLTCPSDQGPNPCPLSYVANCGREDADTQPRATGIFFDRSLSVSPPRPSISVSEIRDGAGQTLMLAERLFETCEEVAPNNPDPPCFEEWHHLGQWTRYLESSVGFVWTIADSKPHLDASRIGTGVPDPWDPDTAKIYPGLKSNHLGGVNVSFCDGHQQFLSEDVNYRVFQLIMTPDSRAAQLEAQVELGGKKGTENDKDWNVDGAGKDPDNPDEDQKLEKDDY